MSAVKIFREKGLGRIALPRDEAIVLRLVEYVQGGRRVDIRRHYRNAEGVERPTSKGAGLKSEWIAKLREALDRFEREAKHG